jgi:hypothetical protein
VGSGDHTRCIARIGVTHPAGRSKFSRFVAFGSPCLSKLERVEALFEELELFGLVLAQAPTSDDCHGTSAITTRSGHMTTDSGDSVAANGALEPVSQSVFQSYQDAVYPMRDPGLAFQRS